MILLSHPTGNQFVRQTAQAFREGGCLAEFWTGLAWNSDSPFNRLLPKRLRNELNRRAYPAGLRPLIRSHPFREAGRLACQSFGIPWWSRHEAGFFSVDKVFQALDRQVARRLSAGPGVEGVYAYEDGAADSFKVAGELGLDRWYDLPIGYWRVARKLLSEEAEREPEWASTLTGNQDSDLKLQRKDTELQCASAVIVASGFTRQTLKDAPDFHAPVHVIPYGAPPAIPEGVRPPRTSGPLRVLYAGSLTQRKGLAYFLRACERVNTAIEVTLIGRAVSSNCRPLESALRRHRYISSLPHHAMLEEMRRQDVLVFPSLFEGFGLVILEAMAQGVPVITTAHTAGPEVITEGEDGFIVPIRDVDSIAGHLETLARDRARLREMSEAARRKATQCGWERYRRGLLDVVCQRNQPAAEIKA